MRFLLSERWSHLAPFIWAGGGEVVDKPLGRHLVFVGLDPPDKAFASEITVITQKVTQAHHFRERSVTGQVFALLGISHPPELAWMYEAEDFPMSAYRGALFGVDANRYYNWRCWRLSSSRIPPGNIKRILGNFDLDWPQFIYLSRCGTAQKSLPYYLDHAACKWCGGDTAVMDLRQRVMTPVLLEAVRQYGRGALLVGKDNRPVLLAQDFIEDQVRHFRKRFPKGRVIH